MTAARVHHSALRVRDIDASLRFYVDGVGLSVLMDHRFSGDWPTLFAVGTTELRSVFLGDPAVPDAGIVELVAFAGEPPGPPAGDGAAGFFLLSLFVDLERVLARLAALGFGPARRIEQPAGDRRVAMATLRDPDDVLVELIDAGASSPGAPRGEGAGGPGRAG